MRTIRVAIATGVLSLPMAGAGLAQIMLPEISVTAPSPIRRAPATVTVQPLAEAPGLLPIVTDQFATVTLVTPGQLLRDNGATLADVLRNRPGITASTFAPGAASRPIVRGLDNYRVRIQENGFATNDVSDLSEDHAVPIDPLAARRIEVIRGPATLRYGSQAIGGVVNAENNRIPVALPSRPVAVELRGGANSGDNGLDGAVSLDAGRGNIAIHADAFARRASDYGIPAYPYLNPPTPAPVVNGRQPNSAASADGQSIGGSYFFDSGFFGVSLTQFNSNYRIPGAEAAETDTRIDMRQTKVNARGEMRPSSGVVEAIRVWLGASDYKHDEFALENGFNGVQQSFTNRGQEARAEVQFAPFDLRFASLTTAAGVQLARDELSAPGLEGGLFDPNNSRNAAAFVFNELSFNAMQRLQVAGRIESAIVNGTGYTFPSLIGGLGIDPVAAPTTQAFTPKSGSIGFLQDLPWGLTASITGQYIERAPRAPELFSRGPHEATGTFEIGNPGLAIESARSVEIGLRRARGQVRFEATAYHTQFSNFIHKALTGNVCDGDFDSCGNGGTEFNQVIYAQRNATFRGIELQGQVDVSRMGSGWLGVDGQYDVVRATFDDGTNVPRIPPQRFGGGVFFRDANWFARVGLLHAAAQNDIAPNETPTTGYHLLKAELSHSLRIEGATMGQPREVTLGIVGDNLLDAEIRNAVSFKKDEVLLPGRTVRVFARVLF